MTRIALIVALTLPFALVACDPTGPVAGDMPICNTDDEGVFVIDAAIDGDTLTADVGYSGCGTVPVSVCWHDGSFMESEPVQAGLALLAPDAGDCDAYFEETVDVDISGLREAYEDGYQTSTGTIIVNLNGTSAEYSF